MAQFTVIIVDNGDVKTLTADSAAGREYEALQAILSSSGYQPSKVAAPSAPAPATASTAPSPASNG